MPKDRVVIAESGLGHADDLREMTAIGVNRFLIGESLMRCPDVTAATRAILSIGG